MSEEAPSDPSLPIGSANPTPTTPSEAHAPRMVVVVAGATAALTVVAALLIAALGPRDGGGQASRAGTQSSATAPVFLSTSDVQGVHDALHDIDYRCGPGRSGGSEVERDAEVILDFAQRYPDARFPVDDETGRTLSLLMTARQGLGGCSPAIAARIDGALPPRYRLQQTTPP